MAAEIIATGGTIGFGLGSMLQQSRELADLAATFANQRDHIDLAGMATGDLAHQRRLTNARTSEDADALALATSQHAINRRDTRLDRLLNGSSLHRRGCLARQRHQPAIDLWPAIKRPPERVHDTTEQAGANGDGQSTVVIMNLIPWRHTMGIAERHHDGVIAIEANHLGINRQAPAFGHDRAAIADRRGQAGHVDRDPSDRTHLAFGPGSIQRARRSDDVPFNGDQDVC